MPALKPSSVPTLATAAHQQAAEELFPNGAPNIDGAFLSAEGFRTLASLLSALAEYADLIALAHDARNAGRIANAERFEARAERIYNRLPAGARW